MKDFFKTKAPWITTVVAVLALIYTLVMGGASVQTFPGKGGSEYEVQLQIPAGIMELVEQCKLKEVGQECEVAANVKVTMKKAPTEVTPETPVVPETKPEPVTETKAIDIKDTPVKKEVDKKKTLEVGKVIVPVKDIKKEIPIKNVPVNK